MLLVNDSLDYKSHSAVYIGPESEDYKSGQTYEIFIQKFSDGRFSVFKSSRHYNESPGYRVFPTLESIKQQFNYDAN